MQLSVSDNVNFKSRNETIRFANDIVRKVKQNYPIISPTYVDCYDNMDSFFPLHMRLHNKCGDMRKETLNNFNNAKTPEEKILSFITPIRKYCIGNCGEFGLLSCLTAKINGLKNCYPAILKNEYLSNFDHAVLYVENKKPYIIDSWLGFADYVPNAKIRYKNEFCKYFDNLNQDNDILFIKQDYAICNYLNSITSNEDIYKLKRLFPELIINH